jgi:hypothetical protein
VGKKSEQLRKEKIQVANKHMRRCSPSYTIRKLKIQTQIPFYVSSFQRVRIEEGGTSKS